MSIAINLNICAFARFKHKKTFSLHLEKWPELEVQMKNWVINMGISVSKEMTIFEPKRWATLMEF